MRIRPRPTRLVLVADSPLTGRPCGSFSIRQALLLSGADHLGGELSRAVDQQFDRPLHRIIEDQQVAFA